MSTKISAAPEGDEEIQDLLRASRGLNLGLHYLAGTFTWDTIVNSTDTLTASKVLWLDAFLTNIDRTVRNTNMLAWRRELWLIDHGASMYFHHSWSDWKKAAMSPFPYVKDHAFIRQADMLDEADRLMHTGYHSGDYRRCCRARSRRVARRRHGAFR